MKVNILLRNVFVANVGKSSITEQIQTLTIIIICFDALHSWCQSTKGNATFDPKLLVGLAIGVEAVTLLVGLAIGVEAVLGKGIFSFSTSGEAQAFCTELLGRLLCGGGGGLGINITTDKLPSAR